MVIKVLFDEKDFRVFDNADSRNYFKAMIEQIFYDTKILPNIFIKISHLRVLQRKYPYRIGKIFRFAHL